MLALINDWLGYVSAARADNPWQELNYIGVLFGGVGMAHFTYAPETSLCKLLLFKTVVFQRLQDDVMPFKSFRPVIGKNLHRISGIVNLTVNLSV